MSSVLRVHLTLMQFDESKTAEGGLKSRVSELEQSLEEATTSRNALQREVDRIAETHTAERRYCVCWLRPELAYM